MVCFDFSQDQYPLHYFWHRYAVERTNSFIKVWFWSRAATGIPSDVTSGATSVNTDNWVWTDLPYVLINCQFTHVLNRVHHEHIFQAPVVQFPQCLALTTLSLIWPSVSAIHPAALSTNTFQGGDWAGNAQDYASSGCPSTCVGALHL